LRRRDGSSRRARCAPTSSTRCSPKWRC
jgi:hypothetical protein